MADQNFTELLDQLASSWTILDAEPGAFLFVNDILQVLGPTGWLRFDRRYSDFALDVEFRFLTDDADSGVFFRAAGDTTFVRGWPNASYQLQMRNPLTPSEFVPLGGLFRHGMPDARTEFDADKAIAATLGTGQWQRLALEVCGERVTAKINGIPVLDADGIGNGKGYIGLQSETGALEFKSVKILEL